MAAPNIMAQSKYTVDNGKVGDNWFVGADLGGTWGLINHDAHNAFWGDINPQFTVRGGKYITPVVGIQAEFESGFAEGNYTFFDHTNLTLDWLCNFNNLFGGYKGSPRIFEVVGVLGAGWFHTYGDVSNSASVKGAVELNINLGKEKAWQLNIIPSFTYLPAKGIEDSYIGLSIGFTYKFKNSNGTHNFTISQLRNQAEIDSLHSEIMRLRKSCEELRKANDRQVVAIGNLEKTIKSVDTGTRLEIASAVGFTIGSSQISDTQLANISLFADIMNKYDDISIEIVGYADRNTGNPETNYNLSYDRAVAVRDILVEKYGVDEGRISVMAKGDTEQPFDENDINRAVIFVQK